MPSKPLFSNADGLVVDSNAKLREYKRQNPGTEVLSADSNDWRNRYDRARNLAEDRAIKRGYRDFQHQNVSRRDKKLERKANEKARRT